MTNSADPDQLASDLNLHCLQRQGISGFSRTRVSRLYCTGNELLTLSTLVGGGGIFSKQHFEIFLFIFLRK